MEFTLTISLGNDAMKDHHDVAWLLENLAHQIRTGRAAEFDERTGTAKNSLWDSNGNRVGYWIVEEGA